jgi:hypothetical protein
MKILFRTAVIIFFMTEIQTFGAEKWSAYHWQEFFHNSAPITSGEIYVGRYSEALSHLTDDSESSNYAVLLLKEVDRSMKRGGVFSRVPFSHAQLMQLYRQVTHLLQISGNKETTNRLLKQIFRAAYPHGSVSFFENIQAWKSDLSFEMPESTKKITHELIFSCINDDNLGLSHFFGRGKWGAPPMADLEMLITDLGFTQNEVSRLFRLLIVNLHKTNKILRKNLIAQTDKHFATRAPEELWSQGDIPTKKSDCDLGEILLFTPTSVDALLNFYRSRTEQIDMLPVLSSQAYAMINFVKKEGTSSQTSEFFQLMSRMSDSPSAIFESGSAVLSKTATFADALEAISSPNWPMSTDNVAREFAAELLSKPHSPDEYFAAVRRLPVLGQTVFAKQEAILRLQSFAKDSAARRTAFVESLSDASLSNDFYKSADLWIHSIALQVPSNPAEFARHLNYFFREAIDPAVDTAATAGIVISELAFYRNDILRMEPSIEEIDSLLKINAEAQKVSPSTYLNDARNNRTALVTYGIEHATHFESVLRVARSGILFGKDERETAWKLFDKVLPRLVELNVSASQILETSKVGREVLTGVAAQEMTNSDVQFLSEAIAISISKLERARADVVQELQAKRQVAVNSPQAVEELSRLYVSIRVLAELRQNPSEGFRLLKEFSSQSLESDATVFDAVEQAAIKSPTAPQSPAITVFLMEWIARAAPNGAGELAIEKLFEGGIQKFGAHFGTPIDFAIPPGKALEAIREKLWKIYLAHINDLIGHHEDSRGVSLLDAAVLEERYIEKARRARLRQDVGEPFKDWHGTISEAISYLNWTEHSELARAATLALFRKHGNKIIIDADHADRANIFKVALGNEGHRVMMTPSDHFFEVRLQSKMESTVGHATEKMAVCVKKISALFKRPRDYETP